MSNKRDLTCSPERNDIRLELNLDNIFTIEPILETICIKHNTAVIDHCFDKVHLL